MPGSPPALIGVICISMTTPRMVSNRRLSAYSAVPAKAWDLRCHSSTRCPAFVRTAVGPIVPANPVA